MFVHLIRKGVCAMCTRKKRVCPNCGKTFKKGDVCSHCGWNRHNKKRPHKEKKGKKR